MMRKVVWMIPVLLGLGLGLLHAQETGNAPETPAPPTGAPSAATTSQPAYQPKFAGDPARSDAEAGALGYMRVVTRAQKDYYKKHNEYAPTLYAEEDGVIHADEEKPASPESPKVK
jgi:hypothetical protein